jgi:hypothetical protein
LFFSTALPYLFSGEATELNHFNVTLVGAGDALRLAPSAQLLARGAVGLGAVILAWLRSKDDVDIRVRLTEVVGIIMLASILCASFAWLSYAIWLLPLLIAVVHPDSLMRNIPVWIGVYLFGSPLETSTPLRGLDFGVMHLRHTAGYLLVLASMGGALAWQRWLARKSLEAHTSGPAPGWVGSSRDLDQRSVAAAQGRPDHVG